MQVSPGLGAPVAANRGASGIDGVLSSAAGFAFGLNRGVTLVVGDISFLHDINGLSLLRSGEVAVLHAVHSYRDQTGASMLRWRRRKRTALQAVHYPSYQWARFKERLCRWDCPRVAFTAGEMRPPLTVVLINNAGGGIFSFLPIANDVDEDVFTQLWSTPQNVDLAGEHS